MILHPLIFWPLLGIVLVILCYPAVLLFACWCDSFKFSSFKEFLKFALQIIVLTIPVGLFLLFGCMIFSEMIFARIYIIDSDNDVKNRYFLFYNQEQKITPKWGGTFYVKNESGKTLYEYGEEYSNQKLYYIGNTGVVSKIEPGKIAELSKKPYSLMQGVADKVVVHYRGVHRPSGSYETFIISEEQYQEYLRR